MHAIRTFVAIDIPSPARQVIAAVQRRFLPLDLKASWVRPENVHLTLKFLGNINPDRVPEIVDALSPVASSCLPFSLSLKETRLFPKKGTPRVLWVGLTDASEQLRRLQGSVADVLADAGFKPDKGIFTPHLTVGRIKSTKNAGKLKAMVSAGVKVESVTFKVAEMVLYKSQLSPEGSRYTVLKALPFGSLPADKDKLNPKTKGEEHGG